MSAPPLELAARLHTAARRYCMERHAHWSETYAQLERAGAGYDSASGEYSHRARALFPRYLQLDAMQLEIEKLEPRALASLEEARAAVMAACERAQLPTPAVRADPLAIPSIEEERTLCLAHVQSLDEDALRRVQPLHYRRVLAPDEFAALTARFTETFGSWYGGVSDRRSAFAYRTFHVPLEPSPAEVLRPLLPARVLEWNESDESFEQDLSAIDFDRSEAFWFTADLSWMVYASHEATLSIAGDAFVRAVDERAPAWSGCRAFGT